jgi:hypothetical protein
LDIMSIAAGIVRRRENDTVNLTYFEHAGTEWFPSFPTSGGLRRLAASQPTHL